MTRRLNSSSRFNPMGNPDPNYEKPENPIIAHYEFADKRLIVKRVTGVAAPKLFIEEKSVDALGDSIWTHVESFWLPEKENIYNFTNEEGSVLMTLAAILLYKRQDLLVDKMEKRDA